jgi:hypothetical protein
MSNDSNLTSQPGHSFWPWSPSRQTLFIKDYCRQLLAEYKSICVTHPEPVEAIEALGSAEAISWGKLHELEYLVLANLPLPIAQRKLLILREQLRALAPSEQYNAIASLQISDIEKASKEEIIAEGQTLLSELQRLRAVHSQFERLRNRIYLCFLLVALVFLPGTGLLATVHHYSNYSSDYENSSTHQTSVDAGVVQPDMVLHAQADAGAAPSGPKNQSPMNGGTGHPGHPRPHPPMLLIVAFAGVLGAYFSVLLRLGKLSWSPEYSINYQQVDKMFWNVISSMALAMMEGGVAAAVLYFLFMSNAVQGDLFPAFDYSARKTMGFFAIMPQCPKDIAKALVWAIAAGFSERLVPDMLDNLAKRSFAKSAPGATIESPGPANAKVGKANDA